MAYTYKIKQNTLDSNQRSPYWVVTFVRWENRNPKSDASESASVRKPMVVVNDCVSVQVNVAKSSHTPSVQAAFKVGDIDYLSAVAPGDFMYVNIVQGEEKALDVYNRAAAGKPINKFDDGFKGFFKVQSVRQTLSVEPSSGIKTELCIVTGFGFTEFNNTIYFNPFLIDDREKNDLLFITRISDQWNQKVGQNNIVDLQTIQKLLISSFLGSGPSEDGKKIKQDLVVSQNTQFYVPDKCGSLLGVPAAKSAKDIYNYLFGVQNYERYSGSAAQGLNPTIKQSDGRFYETAKPITGVKYIQAEYWNQVTLWSILNQYLNVPINEIFTTFKVSPQGSVMPTIVIRQTPFSSNKKTGAEYTRFLTLPRWKVEPELIYSFERGRDEAARINFVQVFGRIFDSNGSDIALNIAKGNYDFDPNDVRRSGLKPWIIYSNFDDYSDKKNNFSLVTFWKDLMSDCVIGQHLKLNGTLSSLGIYEPISVGDNLEFDNVIYHIESVSHNAQITPNGQKTFMTTISLSNGVSKDDSVSKYANMSLEYGEEKRRSEGANGNSPGYTDVQSIPSREPGGEEPSKRSSKRFKG